MAIWIELLVALLIFYAAALTLALPIVRKFHHSRARREPGAEKSERD